MQYQSTKNSSLRLPFDEVLLGNLAPDGGLYVPEKTPHFSLKQINDFQTLTYQELTKTLLYPFVSEALKSKDFENIVRSAYEVFESEEVVKLINLENQRWILELFHGPTMAFKDIAMQLFGALLEYFVQK